MRVTPGQFYPGKNFFTLALLVLLVTNFMSEKEDEREEEKEGEQEQEQEKEGKENAMKSVLKVSK